MFWKDQNKNGDSLLFYVNQDLKCKIVNTSNFPTEIEILSLEPVLLNKMVHFRITPTLRPEFFLEVTKALTFYSEKYDNALLMGDFNMIPENHHLKDFTDSNDFENLIKEPSCFKSTSPTTIDLFLTNSKGCFMKSSTNETGISDCQKLIYTFLKSAKSLYIPDGCFTKFNILLHITSILSY